MTSTTFTMTLIDQCEGLWDRMLTHPFLVQTRDGELEAEQFETWLRQDYLFVEAAIPFVGQLISRAPSAELRQSLGEIPSALETELELFEERAEALGVTIDDVDPGLANHAYVQFLQATAYRENFPTAFTVYWAAEKAYHESWKVVKQGLSTTHEWAPFVDNWAGDEFAALVDFLEGETNRLAESAGPRERERMMASFERTVEYEIAFWQMAFDGPTWPGIGDV